MPPDHPTPRTRTGILRCLSCGTTVECRPADMLRFTRTGWLRCCNEVMTLFVPAGKPGAPPSDDTMTCRKLGADDPTGEAPALG